MNTESTSKRLRVFSSSEFERPAKGRYPKYEKSVSQGRSRTENKTKHREDVDGIVGCEGVDLSINIQDTLENYIQLLVEAKGLTSVSRKYRAFMIQNIKDGKLIDDYHIITRRPVTCRGEYTWLYSCGCDAGRCQVAENIPAQCCSGQAIDQSYPECEHIQAARDISPQPRP